MTEYPDLASDALLRAALGDLSGLALADLGAGSGRVSRLCAALGATVTGVEPNAEAVAAARAHGGEGGEGGGPAYVRASAEATTLAPESVDIALFSLSLHHCPDMPAALAEARRITRAGGRIAVLEPVAPDPLWPVTRYIDDETAVLERAQESLAAALASGALAHRATRRAADKYRVADADALLEDMMSVDPARRLDPADRPAFEAAFAAAAAQDADGVYIPHWLRLDLFERL